MPFTLPTEPSELHQSAPVNNIQQTEQKERELLLLQEKMQETLSKSIDKTKVKHAKTSSSLKYENGSSKSKSPMKSVNPSTYKKISQDLPKSAQKILTDIASRSRSNNTSQHNNSSLSKVYAGQSFKSGNTPQILKNIYTHNRTTQDNRTSENSNIQEETNQNVHDETLESFYREIEKNKEYLSNQRACASSSPLTIDKKLLSTLEKNNQRVQQIYSQIQNQIKHQKTTSPYPKNNIHGKHKPSPSKTDNRKTLYESYSQEKINQILHGGQLLANFNSNQDCVSINNSESRKPSPLFGGRNEENGGTHHSSQDSSSLNQFKSHLTDSPVDQQFNTIPSIPSCVGTGQYVTLPNDCFNSFNTPGNRDPHKIGVGQNQQGNNNNHHSGSNSTSHSNFHFIGKYKQPLDTKGKTQITSLTKFMKKLNNEQYQGSSQLYQQLQRSQKIAQEQMKSMHISPQRKNQQFFGQNSNKESFITITPTRKESAPKDTTQERQLLQAIPASPVATPTTRAFIVKGNSKSNQGTPKNQINTNLQFNQHVEASQFSQQALNQRQQQQANQPVQKQNSKGSGHSNLIIINNKKNQQQQQKNQRQAKDVSAQPTKQISRVAQTTGFANNPQDYQNQYIQNVGQVVVVNNEVQQQIEKLNEQNKIKDLQIEQLNHQVRYLIEQITKQSHINNEDEQSMSNHHTQSFEQKQSDKYNNSSHQGYENEESSNYNSAMRHEEISNYNTAMRHEEISNYNSAMGHEEISTEQGVHNIYSNQIENQHHHFIQDPSFRQMDSQQNNYISQQQQEHESNHYEMNNQYPSQSPYSNSSNNINHQKQLSFSVQTQQHGQNHHLEYSYDNQEVQSEPLNENSIQQLEKRCKTEEEDYGDNPNNYHYIDSINTPPNGNIISPRTAELINPTAVPQMLSQDNNQIQFIQQSFNQQQYSDEQNQAGDIKIVSNFQASLVESIEMKSSVKSTSATISQVTEHIPLEVKKSMSSTSGKADSHREAYKTPHERSMQQPETIQQKVEENQIQDDQEQEQ